MTQNIAITGAVGIDNYYQISDDDVDECEDLGDDCLLDPVDGPSGMINNGRGPYERAWTTDATRALIHIRGPMEGRFSEGRQKRTALWLHCTRQLQKLGYRYSAAKVQKKWHNILITYNKNLSKKYLSGYVHWEFFEDMFKYLKGKRADFDMQQQLQVPQQQQQLQQQQMQHIPKQEKLQPFITSNDDANCHYMNPDQKSMLQHVEHDTKSNDEFDEDSTSMSELKPLKMEYNPAENENVLPMGISNANGFATTVINEGNAAAGTGAEDYHARSHYANTGEEDDAGEGHSTWWKDYFERKLYVEREKIQLQKDMHREFMQFNKMSAMQQEKIERIKIDAINNLSNTLQKLIDSKNRKV